MIIIPLKSSSSSFTFHLILPVALMRSSPPVVSSRQLHDVPVAVFNLALPSTLVCPSPVPILTRLDLLEAVLYGRIDRTFPASINKLAKPRLATVCIIKSLGGRSASSRSICWPRRNLVICFNFRHYFCVISVCHHHWSH